jgi:regulator of nonsense transcripts 1
VPTVLLDTQYRMHPAIARFPAHLFYGGELRDGVSAADRAAPPAVGFQWPREDWPVAFVPITMATGGRGESSADGGSKQNAAEASAVVSAVESFLQGGMAGGDIAVVTPYGAQVRLICRLLRQKGLTQVDSTPTAGANRVHVPVSQQQLKNMTKSQLEQMQQQQRQQLQRGTMIQVQQQSRGQPVATDPGGRGYQEQLQRVEVSSVDGFQGREKQLVIFSAVRSNSHGNVGFLEDWRRVNVAFTRPKRGLVVFGDPHTLEHERATWSHWLGWVRANGLVVGEEGGWCGEPGADGFDLSRLHTQHPRIAQDQRGQERSQKWEVSAGALSSLGTSSSPTDDISARPDPGKAQAYANSGFLTLQSLAQRYIVNKFSWPW